MANPNHSYAHYYLPNNSSSLKEAEWTISVEKIPNDGDWFFAFNPTGFYIGLLVENKEYKAQFSVWNSQGAEAGDGFKSEDINEDGKVIRIKGNYNWEIGKPYQFILKFEEHNNNIVSSLNIKDHNKEEIKVGKQIMPRNWKLKNRIDLFIERLTNDAKPAPLSVSFSEFSPEPAKLTGAEGENENPLGLNISISDNREIIFKSSDPHASGGELQKTTKTPSNN